MRRATPSCLEPVSTEEARMALLFHEISSNYERLDACKSKLNPRTNLRYLNDKNENEKEKAKIAR